MERTRPELTVTLVGSFRYMDQFNITREKLEGVGIKVLAPMGSSVSEVKGGSFRVLDCDQPTQYPIDLEMGFIRSLLASDFGYIIDPEGYMGVASVTETRIAKYSGVPFLAREPINPGLDSTSSGWEEFCRSIEVCSLDKLVARIKNPRDAIHDLSRNNYRAPVTDIDLSDLARYVLSAEWIKHQGLGFVISEVTRHYVVQRAKIPVESKRFPLVSSSTNSPTSTLPFGR